MTAMNESDKTPATVIEPKKQATKPPVLSTNQDETFVELSWKLNPILKTNENIRFKYGGRNLNDYKQHKTKVK